MEQPVGEAPGTSRAQIRELGGSWPSGELWRAIRGMEREKELIEVRPSISAAMARELDEDIERFARF
jgi:hypothetical protein